MAVDFRRIVGQNPNATQALYPQEKLFHALFEEQVERTPHAAAVVFDDQQLSYCDLNAQANQLAHYLRSVGVGPEVLVGVCMERSLRLVVGLLAVFKAGGAIVPLDPEYPPDRLAYMLQDTAAPVVLTQSHLLDRLPEPADASSRQVLGLDTQWHTFASCENTNPACVSEPEHLAYVIYTSGSTGRPKGVMLLHRGVCNHMSWLHEQLQVQPGDRFLQITSISFDASLVELFLPLQAGATIILASPGGHRDTGYLARVMREQDVTIVQMVPAALSSMLSEPLFESCSLRYVVSGGEALDRSLVQELQGRLRHTKFGNFYGPTETSIDATHYEISRPLSGIGTVPIGRPIANAHCYVFDDHLQPVPVGVVGELYIGGVGLARGYLNRPDLTAERFIVHPFSPGQRLYRTGDLVRYLPDGNIEYLGRADFQVKIRGFRIELEEIEAQLARHAQVKKAVVLAREDEPGEKRLVAYVIPKAPFVTNELLSPEALRAHLQSILPDYMVPSAFVMLESLPLTANGKLDRRALPAPRRQTHVSGRYEAPQGELEEILAGIWQALLRVERVGRHDNFFELGGHSLLIVQMLDRLRQAGLSTEVRRVFESASLAALASSLTHVVREQFEAPPNLIPRVCKAIRPEMLPLVELKAQHIERIVQAVPGGCANIQDIYPLAPLQEGLLFHHLLDESGGDPYVRTTLLSLSSRERLEGLIQALQTVIDRHDVLRTAVLWEQLPQPVQVVYREARLFTAQLELDGARDIVEQLKERMAPGHLRLELRQAPPMRLEMAWDSHSGQWYALLQTHHLFCDNLSLDILISEVMTCLGGLEQSLPQPAAYRNHVAQARSREQTQDAEVFFRAKLADIDGPTVPFGVFDVHGDGSRTETVRQTLEMGLAERIRIQARHSAVSAATLFHAAWALVVSRTSGRDDVVFGSVLLGRLKGSAGAQRILGMFINTLPLRLHLRDVTAKELAEQTQRELVDLLSHEQASLAVAQRCSGASGSTPLFSAVLNYRHSMLNPESEWSSAAGVSLLASEGRTNYPLLLSVDDRGEGFVLELETDRRIDAHRMIEYVCTALESLVEALEKSPQTPALSLPILPESERRQLIDEFNNPQSVYSQDRLIHEVFEEQAARRPEAVAVVYEGESLTYAQLNARANQLARYLREEGVGPDQLVGICVERSLEMVVGLLAILKAGGAYVPLDPGYPMERLQYMLSDAAPKVLLTQGHLRSRLASTDATVIALDDEWGVIGRGTSNNREASPPRVRSDHLAYVIYTSGSTGQPKGVMVEHGNVSRLFAATEKWFEFNERDVWTMFHSFAFDFSVWELWGALLHGGRLVVVPHPTARSPQEFYRLVCEEGVTVLNQTPSAFAQLIETQARSEQQHSLRVVIFGGEALELRTLRRWVARNGAQAPQLVNMYGITETTVHVTYRALSEEEIAAEHRGSPIGKPIEDLRVYLLDRYRQPVPIGVPGELYVAGAGVARGYLNRSELTAERFISDPFGTGTQARMYKSGDLGRWRADGTIEYLGRNDSQVKIRGFRIEVGEIEARLAQHPRVKEAVVLAREDVPGEKRLVAYVVPAASSDTPTVSAEMLRAHLKQLLPDYMVPSAFVMMESFPLTANGKLDRRALRVPDRQAHVSGQYEAPNGEVEEILAGIWQNLLRVERVGRQDNFFELGGHSLLIVQMLEQLRGVGLSTEVRRVFESSTLSDLAGAISSVARGQFEAPPNLIPHACAAITPSMLSLINLDQQHIDRIVTHVPGGASNIQDIYPLAPLQEGILFHHLLKEEGGDAYLVQTLLSLSSRERLEQLLAALQAVIDRHDALRTAVLWEQLPQPVQVVYRQATLPVQERMLIAGQNPIEYLQTRMQLDCTRLDLRQAPLLRVEVVADSHGPQWYALLQMHHIVDDATSLKTVISEVVAHLEGRALTLLDAMPYRTHVAQALAYAKTHDAESFFRDKLGDIDEPTVPFGLFDVHGDGSGIDEAHEELEPKLVQRVRTQASRLRVSAATVLHAAWGLVVARASGRNDVVFGSVLLGRFQGSAGAQPIVGMFINTLPLRLRLRDLTATELVEQTQRELVELLSHEQASLAVAQRCSGVANSRPLFSALLNYRHAFLEHGGDWSDASGVEMLAEHERTNYPIVVSVNDLGERMTLTAQTDRRIGPQRLIGYLQTAVHALMEALEKSPQTPALSLSILPESERRQVIEVFNATQALYPQEKLIHALFEEQVERTPHAVAVIWDSDSLAYVRLTYAELNARANQVARYLVAQGVQAGEYIPILMPRCLELLIAQIAVLKSGGVYVPVDPAVPAERQAFVIRDCAARHVLTDQEICAEIARDVHWINCATLVGTIRELPDGNLALPLESPRAAYVMYTSGSTGVPKGVVVPHHAVNCLVLNNYAQIVSSDCIAHCSNPTFDLSTFEIWAALLNGASVLIVPVPVVLDAERFARLLRQHDITILWLTAGLLAQYTEALSGVFGQLRYLLTGGDVVEPATVRRVLGHQRPKHLLNGYGPTECTTFASTYEIETISEDTKTIPIGRPIANTRIYILDAELQPVPLGVAGEIYIGGKGVALGYLKRPQLTAERFIADPFCADPHARLYKSGDLGRWRADGTIEFLGRNDSQVKIRGFRIELGEIEATLESHSDVKQAVVIGREDVPGEKRLVAYVIPKAPSARSELLSAEMLRANLQLILPDYMVPSAYVMLESLPLTANGKLNRRALPAPTLRSNVGGQYEAPKGEVEETLAAIWRALLQVERVGRRDHFFELGGHSLLALQLLVRIDQSLGRALNVSDVYRNPTLQELATRIGVGASADGLVDLSREALLDDVIVSKVRQRRVPPQAVLLTGCTGFVGRFLLAELLRDTDTTIYCLVRAQAQQQAKSRLEATLQKWDLWTDEVERRVVVIPANLSRPRLGLRDGAYEVLSETVDSIYHCATSMNHLETYAMAKPANVDATRDLLRLATDGRPKLINYISTLGVFGSTSGDEIRVVTEDSPIDRERHPSSEGYAASKWVSEKMFMTAGERGIACNIFRLGLVWADAQQGRYDELQREYRLFKSCLLSGLGIKDYRYDMAPVPVDYVARAIVSLASRYPNGRGIFHLASSEHKADRLFEQCNDIAETSLELVSRYEWISAIKRLHYAGRSLPVVPLVEFAFPMSEAEFHDHQRKIESARTRFDCARTNRELENAGFVVPRWNADLLRTYLGSMLSKDEELKRCAAEKQSRSARRKCA
jgi:amino acid adenylation domain-containing protein/thioester reductase-like protein